MATNWTKATSSFLCHAIQGKDLGDLRIPLPVTMVITSGFTLFGTLHVNTFNYHMISNWTFDTFLLHQSQPSKFPTWPTFPPIISLASKRGQNPPMGVQYYYQYSFFRNPCILHFFNFARSSYDLLQFFYFVNSLNLPQSMTKHSFVVLRLSRYFLSHAQPQPYVLPAGLYNL